MSQTSGTVERYLIAGPHAEAYARLTIEENELVAATDMNSLEEINIEEIAAIDVEKAIEFLRASKAYHGK